MRIAYIAHPISGNIEENLKSIREIVRYININEPDTVPFVPYYADVVSLDDNNPEERKRGIKNDKRLLESGIIDQVRLYGKTISKGMWEEIRIADRENIDVVPMTEETKNIYWQTFSI